MFSIKIKLNRRGTANNVQTNAQNALMIHNLRKQNVNKGHVNLDIIGKKKEILIQYANYVVLRHQMLCIVKILLASLHNVSKMNLQKNLFHKTKLFILLKPRTANQLIASRM